MINVEPLYIVGVGLLRSVIGWFKSSMADKKIDEFEYRQLGETVARVGLIGLVVIYFPGLNVSWFEAAIVALGGDLVLQTVKKINLKKK